MTSVESRREDIHVNLNFSHSSAKKKDKNAKIKEDSNPESRNKQYWLKMFLALNDTT